MYSYIYIISLCIFTIYHRIQNPDTKSKPVMHSTVTDATLINLGLYHLQLENTNPYNYQY